MKAEDKFGRRIYPKTFLILKKYGEILAELGWEESRSKPNLFYKMFDEIMVFADMRGTEIVPIWEDPCPLMYAAKGHEDWKTNANRPRRAIGQIFAVRSSLTERNEKQKLGNQSGNGKTSLLLSYNTRRYSNEKIRERSLKDHHH
jgi:hypothetical protein